MTTKFQFAFLFPSPLPEDVTLPSSFGFVQFNLAKVWTSVILNMNGYGTTSGSVASGPVSAFAQSQASYPNSIYVNDPAMGYRIGSVVASVSLAGGEHLVSFWGTGYASGIWAVGPGQAYGATGLKLILRVHDDTFFIADSR